MRFIVYMNVSADSKEEALEKATGKIAEANAEFQVSDCCPPDLDWAKSAGVHIKKKA